MYFPSERILSFTLLKSSVRADTGGIFPPLIPTTYLEEPRGGMGILLLYLYGFLWEWPRPLVVPEGGLYVCGAMRTIPGMLLQCLF